MIDGEKSIDREGLGKKTALIRELHVYGSLQSIKQNDDPNAKVQHTGLGKQLLSLAEKLSQKAGYEKLSVISGV